MLFTCLLATFAVVLTRVLQNLVLTTHSVFIYHVNNVLLQNIVGVECIACTHWLNTVGAGAPTAPMVPTTTNFVGIDGSIVLRIGVAAVGSWPAHIIFHSIPDSGFDRWQVSSKEDAANNSFLVPRSR